MSKKPKEKSLTLMFPFVSDEKQENLVSFLESNGFEIKNLKARASFGDLTISCSRTSPIICLCCLAPLQDADLKESNQLCIYCSAGNCEIDAAKLKFEKGHGSIQHVLHSAEEEETEDDEITEDDLDLGDDDTSEEDGTDEDDEE
jgi:hypothetical protein